MIPFWLLVSPVAPVPSSLLTSPAVVVDVGLKMVTGSLVVRAWDMVSVPLTEMTTIVVCSSRVDTGTEVDIMMTAVVDGPTLVGTTIVDEGVVVVEGAAVELGASVVVLSGVVVENVEVDGVEVGVVDDGVSLVENVDVDAAAVLADAPVPKGTLVCFSFGSFLSRMASVKESTASSARTRYAIIDR